MTNYSVTTVSTVEGRRRMAVTVDGSPIGDVNVDIAASDTRAEEITGLAFMMLTQAGMPAADTASLAAAITTAVSA